MKIIWIALLLPALALAEDDEVFVAPDAPVIVTATEVESEDLEPTPLAASEEVPPSVSPMPLAAPKPEEALLATPVETPGAVEIPEVAETEAPQTVSPEVASTSPVNAESEGEKEDEEAAVAAVATPLPAPEPPLGPTAEEGYGSIEMKNQPTIVEANRDTASEPTPSNPDL